MKSFARQFIVPAAMCGLTIILSACQQNDTVNLGFVAGITGRAADLGVSGRNGAQLAVEERNAAGGIHGHPVELIVRNDEQNPETARLVIKELIDKNVAAIICPMTRSMAIATLPLINASKTVMVSPTVTTTELAGKDDNFIRVIATTSAYAAKTAACQYRCGHRAVAAIYDLGNRSYTESWLSDFRTNFEMRGGHVVKTVPFQSSNNAVFSGMVKELLAARPDTILIISNAVDAALICQQIRKLDTGVQIVMAEWAATEHFIDLAGKAAEGVHVSQFLNREDRSARYLTFLKAFRERFGQEPGFAGLAAYDATEVALEALARRQPGKTLKMTILNARVFQGVQQAITFDRFGEADRKTFLTVIRNGQYVTLE